MKISSREMSLGLITFTCLLGGLAYMTFDSLYGEWKLKKDQIGQLERQIKLNTVAIKKEKSWLKELNSMQAELQTFDLEETSVGPDLAKMIRNLAVKNELEILSSRPQPEKQTDNLSEIGIQVSWQGNLPALVNFLAELQNQGTRYDVRSLNVVPNAQKAGTLKGNMVIHCAFTRMKKSAQRPVAATSPNRVPPKQTPPETEPPKQISPATEPPEQPEERPLPKPIPVRTKR